MQTRTKIVISAIVLILASSILWTFNKRPSPLGLQIDNTIKTKVTPVTNLPTNNKQEPSKVKKVLDKVVQVTIPTVYDNDPVVDIQLIISNNRFCYRHLSNITQTKDYLEQIKMRVSEEQFNYYQNYTSYCEKLKKEHPEFQLTNKQRFIEQNKTNKAASRWGQIINGEIDANTLDDFEIQSLLKQNDANILSLAPKYLDSYYQKVIHWELEDVLQNHQYDYVTYIRQHSHQLYICNIGVDCNPNSSVMARLCFRNSMSCGLTFQEYINSVLTQGQQADIQLALAYLRNQYQ